MLSQYTMSDEKYGKNTEENLRDDHHLMVWIFYATLNFETNIHGTSSRMRQTNTRISIIHQFTQL